MAAAVYINYLAAYDLTVFYIIKLKLPGMSEMLEYLTVLISYCNSHIYHHPKSDQRDLKPVPNTSIIAPRIQKIVRFPHVRRQI